MSAKPVNLTTHKNHRIRRHAKEQARQIRGVIQESQETFGENWTGFALVTWDDKGRALAYWDGTKTLHPCPIAEYAAHIIRKVQAQGYAHSLIAPIPEDDA